MNEHESDLKTMRDVERSCVRLLFLIVGGGLGVLFALGGLIRWATQ